jgi:hypothetical protein
MEIDRVIDAIEEEGGEWESEDESQQSATLNSDSDELKRVIESLHKQHKKISSNVAVDLETCLSEFL